MKHALSEILIGIALCALTATPAFSSELSLRTAQRQLHTQDLYFGEIDGRTGPETEAALRRFQIRKGLPVTGKLDAATKAAFASAAVAKPVEGPEKEFSTWAQPRIGASAGPDDFEKLSHEEMLQGSPLESAPAWKQKAAVREAQKRLNARGFECGVADGVPGPKTRAAVAGFQTVNQLANSGRIDAATYTAIGISEADLKESSASRQVNRSKRSGRNREGIGSRAKRTVKRALGRLGL